MPMNQTNTDQSVYSNKSHLTSYDHAKCSAAILSDAAYIALVVHEDKVGLKAKKAPVGDVLHNER